MQSSFLQSKTSSAVPLTRLAAPAGEFETAYQGIPIVIEWKKGSTREGKDKDGKPWTRTMHDDYGFIPGTVGAGDKEPLDVYVSEDDQDAPEVFVIEQLKEDGKFDEYKCFLGYLGESDAWTAYLSHYPEGWEDRIGGMYAYPIEEFKKAVFEHQDEGAFKTAAEKPRRDMLDTTNPKTIKGQNWKPRFDTSNPKSTKGESFGYLTGILYLAPANEAGYGSVCPWASLGCEQVCLYESGRGAMKNTQSSRVKKTIKYHEDRAGFMKDIEASIATLVRRAEKMNLIPAIRINGTSDLPHVATIMARRFPSVQFYDYTKAPRSWRNTPENYHLTFSRSEENEEEALQALRHGVNVAIVFDTPKGEPLPPNWQGFRVIDGDEHDLRFLDGKDTGGKALVVGLRAKGKKARGNADTSGFIVHVNDLANTGNPKIKAASSASLLQRKVV